MENPNILVDTSIIIEHLRKTQRKNTQLHELIGRYRLYTSSVVEFELRAGVSSCYQISYI
jgi:tRNA(fMet)-specific endonuclease VapC